MSATFVITRRKGKFTPKTKARQTVDAARLVKLFEGMECEAFFTGGAGLALSQGELYRNHLDFDIAVFYDDLETIAGHLQNKGYSLVKKSFMTHLSPWHDIQLMTNLDPKKFDLSTRNTLKIKILKKGTPLRVIRKLDHLVDLFIWMKNEHSVIPAGHNTTIPLKDIYPTTRISERSSLVFPNKTHKKHIPIWTERQYIDYEKAGLEYIKKN